MNWVEENGKWEAELPSKETSDVAKEGQGMELRTLEFLKLRDMLLEAGEKRESPTPLAHSLNACCEPKMQSRSPTWVMGAQSIRLSPLPPRLYISRELESGIILTLNLTQALQWKMHHVHWSLSSSAKCLPWRIILNPTITFLLPAPSQPYEWWLRTGYIKK